jgi:hypothetical protein
MRTIMPTLIAVSGLGLVGLPASAFDGKTFYEQPDRQGIDRCRMTLRRSVVGHVARPFQLEAEARH